MTQSTKSAIFIGVAAVAALAAVAMRPTMPTVNEKDMRGKPLTAEFDPTTAASLDILEFDDSTSTLRPFQVAEAVEKGKTLWRIPSHENYPADAKEQLAGAATALLGLKVLDVVGDSPGDHAQYGVLDPQAKDLRVGAVGVGTRVTMKDNSGKPLLSLILGKPVKDKPDLRYVRLPDQDAVYVVAVKTDKISAKFGDWIEKDLLKMTSWDMKDVFIHDYSVDFLQEVIQRNADLSLSYDDAAEPKWKLLKEERYRENQGIPAKLAADEELNTARLDEMKTALDDLKIVDVARKPPGLSADLKAAANFLSNREAVESLLACGFIYARVEGGRKEFLSNEGEIRFLMKDGVEYVLRFGAKALGKGAAKKGEKQQASGDANRYLFVMAEFNPDAIAKPALELLPVETKDAKGIKKPADAKGAAKKDEKKDEKKPAEVAAERQRIEKENKRKQDEYEEKLTKGKDRVKELNARFADWYYVISDDVYRKIHLTRDQVIKKKEKKAAGAKDAAGQPAHEHEHGEHEHDHHHDEAAPESNGPIGDLDKLKREGPGGKK